MDCQTALEILEAVRPERDDLSDPAVAEAVAHVESHTECERELRRRRFLDREIGRVVRDVPVPAGLKDRLLVGLAGGPEQRTPGADRAESADNKPLGQSPPVAETIRPLYRRRGVLAATAAAVVVAAAALLWWQLTETEPSRVDWVRLQGAAAQEFSHSGFDFNGLRDFGEPYATELPAVWQAFEGQRLTVAGPKAYQAKAIVAEPIAGKTFALYRLSFTGAHGSTVTGYLLVLPKSAVSHPPEEESFAEAVSRYPTPTMQTAAWSSGRSSGNELLYICFLPPGNSKQQLEGLLRGSFG